MLRDCRDLQRWGERRERRERRERGEEREERDRRERRERRERGEEREEREERVGGATYDYPTTSNSTFVLISSSMCRNSGRSLATTCTQCTRPHVPIAIYTSSQ